MDLINKVRVAVDAALGNTDKTVRRAGDTLHDAFARKLGIPLLVREDDPDAPRVVPNRADLRRMGKLSAGTYSHYEPQRSPKAKPWAPTGEKHRASVLARAKRRAK